MPGLSDTPAEEAAKAENKDKYEDCDPEAEPLDVDCAETWIFPSDCKELGEYACFKQMTSPPTCTDGDLNCYVGFLRAMCASEEYNDRVCETPIFGEALRKENDCLPGKRWCDGFQKIFGGPKDLLKCHPWDFDCALKDYFGDIVIDDGRKKYPLLARMPKSSLTIAEVIQVDEYTKLLNNDIWSRGLNEETLTSQERSEFYTLGVQIMTDEGFADFYQGADLSSRLQEQID